MPKRVDLFGHDKGLGDTVSRVIKTVTRGKVEECNRVGGGRRRKRTKFCEKKGERGDFPGEK